MEFTKMHGIGNDFVVVDCMTEKIDFDLSKLAELVCNRRFGIGADGLMLVLPSDLADFRMNLYNSDGSFAEMCGNGIRCFAKYIYDKGLTNMPSVRVETPSGIKEIALTIKDGKVSFATVDMGVATLLSHDLGIKLSNDTYSRSELTEILEVDGRELSIVFLDTGVPHTVVFADIESVPFYQLGPTLESHPRFPAKTNVDFTEVIDDSHLAVRVWERGAGETMACGTGACAAAVSAYLLGFVGSHVDVRLPGGSLMIDITEDGHIMMCGPATEVYKGTFEI